MQKKKLRKKIIPLQIVTLAFLATNLFPVFAFAIAPAEFQIETLVGGLNLPTAMVFVPDGRIFIAEKAGKVRVVKDGNLLPTPLISLPDVNDQGDHGILGLTIDPNFSQNGYIYISYTFENSPNDYWGPKTGRVVRFTVQGDTAEFSSRLIILGKVAGDAAHPSCDDYAVTSDCIASDSPSHSVGGLHFGPDGKLYAELGDGAGFLNVDSRSHRAQNLDSLAGKMLRINADGTAPADNPFYTGDPNANKSKVWYYGLRNSYRFNFRPSNGTIYFGEVGWSNWEEINIGKKGANYGWPCREGYEKQAEYNCDVYGYTDPIYVLDHSAGTAAITGGSFPTNNAYPQEYMSSYFFGDATGSKIHRMVVDANDNFISSEVFFDNAKGPVDIETGPDGRIYYLAIYTGELRRINYVSGNHAPVAVIQANPISGDAPLQVHFSGNASTDQDNDALNYSWTFGDGGTSNQKEVDHTYNTIGNYTATLTVNDGKGGMNSKNILIRVAPQTQNKANPKHIQTTVSPVPTYIGGNANIKSVVNNTGTTDPIIVDMEVYNKNNTLVAQKIFENEIIQTNSSKEYDFSWFPDAIGNYRVSVGLFQKDWTGLYEWTDNALNFDIINRGATTTGSFKPEFKTAAVPPTSPTNQNIPVQVSVTNAGGLGSALIDIEVYKGDVKVGQQFFDNTAFVQGETRNFTYNFKTDVPGTYSVSVGIFKPEWSGFYSWNGNATQFVVSSTGGSGPVSIFSEGLASGWENWSWNTDADFNAQATAYEGSKSIGTIYKGIWAGLYLHTNSLSTSNRSKLTFAINGGENGGQNIQVIAYGADGNGLGAKKISDYIGATSINNWKFVSIPLADIQAQDKTITGFAFQDIGGTTNTTFYIDSVQVE